MQLVELLSELGFQKEFLYGEVYLFLYCRLLGYTKWVGCRGRVLGGRGPCARGPSGAGAVLGRVQCECG